MPPKLPSIRRNCLIADIHHGVPANFDGSPNLSEGWSSTDNPNRRSIVAIAPFVRPGRALINPFDSTHVTIKLTSNRRRRTRVFPKGPTGVLKQQHHYQAVPSCYGTYSVNYSIASSHFNSCD